MARVDSTAVGGYYKTPTHLLPSISALVSVGTGKEWSIVDPCAGDGEAVFEIAKGVFGTQVRACNVFACEMEETRYHELRSQAWSHGVGRVEHAHGDAMSLVWSRDESYGSRRAGASLLYLNPPYDTDREHKRLEERFLSRFVSCLAPSGVLMFVVPHYALAASADTLARNFTDLHCVRFADEDFAAFKQVVLVGPRRPTLREPDAGVRARVMAWSESVDSMPVLGSVAGLVSVPGHASYMSGFSKWAATSLDIQGLLARAKPWHSTDRGGRLLPVSGVVPGKGDLLARRYPLAVPPKPAHLAAAIASGVFNGAEVRPDDPSSKLPRLRVKGVFDKEFVTADEKKNKDGEKVGEVQIQQPKLVVTVLDVERAEYRTLTAEKKDEIPNLHPSSVGELTTQGLLRHYGRGLMHVMLDQCPVLHDPANDADRFTMPALARPLYTAQEEAVRAIVKLILNDENVYLLGEIGSGKSGCAAVAAQILMLMSKSMRAFKVLVMCPPHLLQGWTDQVHASVLGARVSVLDSIDAVDAWGSDREQGLHFGVMSREAAKLGHGYDGVRPLIVSAIGSACPKCGGPMPVDKDGIAMTPADMAAKRVRHQLKKTPDGKWAPDGTAPQAPRDALARAARDIALVMMLVSPKSPEVNQLVRGRVRDKMMIVRASKLAPAAWERQRPKLRPIVVRLVHTMLASGRERAEEIGRILLGLLAGINADFFTLDIAERAYASTVFDMEQYGTGASVRAWARDMLVLVRNDVRMGSFERMRALGLHVRTFSYGAQSDVFDSLAIRMAADADPESYRTGIDSSTTWGKHPRGSVACVVDALGTLSELGVWQDSEPCGEPLYQAIPEPRRIALAKYLARKHGRKLDLFILDEAHEAAGDGSAQGLAAARIVALGMPTIALTGSVMNGYAESLFNNQWSLDQEFRKEFPRTARRAFNRRYGYLKVLVQHADKDGKVIEWGSQSDRRETTKEIGNAPGVLPLFMLRYLLRTAVTLHKGDLALDLPPHVESVGHVDAGNDLMSRYHELLSKLKDEIKSSRFEPLLAGKLFGALSELPSYLDRATADCGNREDGSFAVAYPENEDLGPFSGRVIASFDGLPASTVLPKERWMLETIEASFRAGQRVMIFAWHESVLPRLHRLIERELGEKAGLLLASKVQAKKRQDWIDEKVIRAKRRVLVVNGAAVKTGLNNLVWFQKAIWMENPGVDPQTKRQADGRIDRIGKKGPTESCFPVYTGTLQETAHRLLMHKVGVSMAVDGLNAEGALEAAGVGQTDTMDAFSVGRALWEMMERGEVHKPIVKPANDVKPAQPAKPKQLSLF